MLLPVAQPCRYCFYSLAQKWFLTPQGRHVNCPDVWSAPPCQLSRLSGQKMWEYSSQNCQNFEFWPEICTSGATRLQFFYEILSVCTRLQVAFMFLVWSLSRNKHPSYKHFPAVGAFFHKFSIAPSGETTDRIKKVRGAKTGRTSSITMPSMVGIVGRAPAV